MAYLILINFSSQFFWIHPFLNLRKLCKRFCFPLKCREVIRLAWCTTTQQGWPLVAWQTQAVSRQVEASKRGLLTAILKGVSPKSRLKLSQVRKTRASEVIQLIPSMLGYVTALWLHSCPQRIYRERDPWDHWGWCFPNPQLVVLSSAFQMSCW